MSLQTAYETKRLSAEKYGNDWDDLDFIFDFDDNVQDALGNFPTWNELTSELRAKVGAHTKFFKEEDE